MPGNNMGDDNMSQQNENVCSDRASNYFYDLKRKYEDIQERI